MMSDKVSPGQRWYPSAGFHNACVDSNAWVKRQQGAIYPGSRASTQQPSLYGYNDSGEDCPYRGCVKLEAPRDIQGDHLLKFKKPSTTFSRSYAFALEPIAAGEIGRIAYEGEALYDTGTPAYDECFGPKPSEWKLFKNYPGYLCRGIQDSTLKIIVVQRDLSPLIVSSTGVSAASELVPGTGTGEIVMWNGSEYEDAGFDSLTIRNLGKEITLDEEEEEELVLLKVSFIGGLWLVDNGGNGGGPDIETMEVEVVTGIDYSDECDPVATTTTITVIDPGA
jgi:hypothetical protein